MSQSASIKMRIRRLASVVSILLIGLACFAGGAEWYLASTASDAASLQPKYQRLAAAHAPYSARQPHPKYGFMFPASLSESPDTGMVRLSEGGFRGPGPGSAGDRALAFLVGNSVVFGFVRHDSLAITGFLNRLQDSLFFVNAGVPSWVSYQMQARTVDELLGFHPLLVVFWGGYNDAHLAYLRAVRGLPFVSDLTEDASPAALDPPSLLSRLLPNISARLRRTLLAPSLSVPAPEVADAAADAFVRNALRARNAVSGSGANFLVVYQPILVHHSHTGPQREPEVRRVFFERFHSRVISEAGRAGLPLLDLADLFDKSYDTIPVFHAGAGPDLDGQIFVDNVHLNSPGNRIVAETILRNLPVFEAQNQN